MATFDTNEILARIGDADLARYKTSRILTFRGGDGVERPVGWSTVAELEKTKALTANYIVGAARTLIAEAISTDEAALAAIKDYVLGLSDDFRPSYWDRETMDEWDSEQLDQTLRNALGKCLGWDDDPFRVAYRIRYELQIEGDVGIIPVAEGLIRRVAEIGNAPELLDRAADKLASEAEKKSQMLRGAFRVFREEQQTPGSGPSL